MSSFNSSSVRNRLRGDDGLAQGRRRREDISVVRKQRRRLVLLRRQFPKKSRADCSAFFTLIAQLDLNAGAGQQLGEIVETSSRQRHMVWKQLGAGNPEEAAAILQAAFVSTSRAMRSPISRSATASS